MDHFFQMEALAPAEEPMLEAYTTLGYVAAQTQRMTLGVLVTGVMYRYPGLLAKTVTTLDVLSGGRARLGIGASWYEREQRGLGVPVVPVAERFERLEETLRICLQMWSDDNGPFEGRHYQLAETLNSPQPLRRPHPPIMIGGSGEKKTLLLVARYADACNLFGTGADGSRTSSTCCGGTAPPRAATTTASKRRCLASKPPLEDLDGFLAEVADYAALGVTEVQVTPDRHPVEFAERLGDEVLPELADIG